MKSNSFLVIRVKHMSRSPDPTTRAMWAFVVAALTHPVDVDDADAIATPPTIVAVSQKVGHRLKVDRKMTRQNFGYTNLQRSKSAFGC